MKSLQSFTSQVRPFNNLMIIFILLIGISKNVFGQNVPTFTSKSENTADGFVYRVITPVSLTIDKSTPVYFLYSFESEGKILEAEYLKLMHTSKFVLVVIEGLKDFNGIGQLRQIYLDVSSSVHKNYAVHAERNYFTGNMEGAVIAMAIAKWVDKEVKGVLLFDGVHQPIQGHPLLKCPIYAFAKVDSKELRALQSLKPKFEEFNKDFTIIDYENKVGLPENKMISNALSILNEKWIRYNDDLITINVSLRQELSEKDFKNIEFLFVSKKFEETYECIEGLINDFSNTSDKKILGLIEKAQKLKLIISKEVSVQALIENRIIIAELKSRENNYKNLLDTMGKLKGLIGKYPLTKSSKMSEEEIKKIQEIIFSRKLNIENKNAKDVVAEFIKFVDASNLSADAKDIINKEYKKAEEQVSYSDLIANCLVLMNKEYASGIIAFGSEKMKTAEKYFDKIKPEDNPYLKAYQLYYLARVNIILDNFERAEEILNDFLKSHLNYTTHQADAFFLLAVCYYNQFKREKARSLLIEFEKRFPDAPERMIIGAYQLTNKIDAYEEGSMSDVEERMEYSRRKLKMEDIDRPAEDNQERIVTLLNKLIKEAEQQEQNQRDKNKGKGGKSGEKSEAPAEESNAPEGESKIGQLKKISRGNRDDEWGKDRDKEREKIMNALKEKFPERYRELIEQYYKGLHKNDE